MLLLKGQQNNTQSHQLNLDRWKVALIQWEISLGTQVICIFSKCLTYLQQLGRLTLQKLKLFKMNLHAKKAAGPLHKGSLSHGAERDSNVHLHSSGHSEGFPRRNYSKSLSESDVSLERWEATTYFCSCPQINCLLNHESSKGAPSKSKSSCAVGCSGKPSAGSI